MVCQNQTKGILICIFMVQFSAATLGPCIGQVLGGTCRRDDDCDGPFSSCFGKTCSCSENFAKEVFKETDQGVIYKCVYAPDKFGAPCKDQCRAPFVCKDGSCTCDAGKDDFQGGCTTECKAGQQLIGRYCQKASSLGGSCLADSDCITPLSECRGRRCQCAQGVRQIGATCTPTCPDGSTASKTCSRKYVGFPSLLNFKSQTDTCGSGQYCAVFGKPSIGYCCPLRCPFGSPASGSCTPGARNKCDLDSHMCYEIQGYHQRNVLCCPRACREPKPYLVNGKCLARVYRSDRCEEDVQCDQGVTMQCRRGRCECRAGMIPTGRKYVTCVKSCGDRQVSNGLECLSLSKLGGSCKISDQCPGNQKCQDGSCSCPCGYGERNGRCLRLEVLAAIPNSLNAWIAKIREVFSG